MSVHIKNQAVVSEKLSKIKGSANDLHIIIDFDRTLTSPEGTTSWGVLGHSKALSKAYHEKSEELYNKFHPIEIDKDKSLAERYQVRPSLLTTCCAFREN